MPTPLDTEGPLYLPTREDPAINQLFENASPCPECGAGQQTLWPVQSAEHPGVYAVMCDCGHIGGDGSRHCRCSHDVEQRGSRHCRINGLFGLPCPAACRYRYLAMALITCKDCQEKFSTDSARCPHCGAKKGMSHLAQIFVAVSATFVFLVIVSSFATTPKSADPPPKTAADIAAEAAAEKARVDECKAQLIKYPNGFFVRMMDAVYPSVMVGSAFYFAPYDKKQAAAELLNCVLVKGQHGYINFDFVDWQSGKTVGRFRWGQVEMQ